MLSVSAICKSRCIQDILRYCRIVGCPQAIIHTHNMNIGFSRRAPFQVHPYILLSPGYGFTGIKPDGVLGMTASGKPTPGGCVPRQ